MRARSVFPLGLVLCFMGSAFGQTAVARKDSSSTNLARAAVTGAQPTAPTTNTPTASNAQAFVPQLIKFSGTLTDLAGKPISGPADVTFSLYTGQEGGTPLWSESQTVNADAAGQYTALLGEMTTAGVPMQLFASGQARWLGVMVRGLPEQPRILLVSVPYAMTAGNAETLGGKPASDFLLATPSESSSATTPGGSSTASAGGKRGNPKQLSIGSGGTTNYLAGWVNSSTLGTSNVYQDPTTNDIGIGTTSVTSLFQVNPAAVTPGSGTYTINAPTAAITPSGNLPMGAVTTALWLEGNYASNSNWTRGIALELGEGNTVYGHYTSRLVDFSNPYATVGTRLQLQTHSTSSDTWNTGLFMDESGNVGIGTTGPQSTLDIAGTQLQISDPSQALANYSYLKTSAYTFNTQKLTLGTTQGYSTPVDALTIFNGKVGIGTTSPAASLEVNGTAQFDSSVTFAQPITTSGVLTSTVGGGTAPLSVNSTTEVSNLNVGLLGGVVATDYARVDVGNTFTGNQTINGGSSGDALDVKVGGNDALTVDNLGTVTVGGGTGSHITTGSANSDFAGATISVASGQLTSGTQTFATPYAYVPVCTATPFVAPGANPPTSGIPAWYITYTSSNGQYTSFTLNLVSANPNSNPITFNYVCVGNPN